MRPAALVPLIAIVLSCWPAAAQTVPESYVIYTEAPRLFLRPQRLRLLRRERERKSLRWDQFERLMAGQVAMAEPGFAGALYYKITNDGATAKRAIAWATGQGTDVRQLALVYDWCQDAMSADEKNTIAAKLTKALNQPGNSANQSISKMRDQALAAIALASDAPEISQRALRSVVEQQFLPRIKQQPTIAREDALAMWELFHAVRDNLNADLRESAAGYFKEFPIFHLISHYPASFPAAENEYRIPISKVGEPDLHEAALSRAAELSMVALDSNAPETQVLQGWLMNDRFLMRGAFGIPYEMMWANPYQPGLSYYLVPLAYHDDRTGALFIRSSWEDDATWLGLFDKQLQIFQKGSVAAVDPASIKEPIELEDTLVLGNATRQFQAPAKPVNDVFILGETPRAAFHVEVEDEDMTEIAADVAGTLYLKGLRGKAAVRVNAR